MNQWRKEEWKPGADTENQAKIVFSVSEEKMPGCKSDKYQILGYESEPPGETLSDKWGIRRCDLMNKVWAGLPLGHIWWVFVLFCFVLFCLKEQCKPIRHWAEHSHENVMCGKCLSTENSTNKAIKVVVSVCLDSRRSTFLVNKYVHFHMGQDLWKPKRFSHDSWLREQTHHKALSALFSNDRFMPYLIHIEILRLVGNLKSV